MIEFDGKINKVGTSKCVIIPAFLINKHKLKLKQLIKVIIKKPEVKL